jgi:Lrp/AsnC family leucine-responsive transcriptional regulator
MDKIDRKILEILQQNCQISNFDLADKIALSPSSCLRRYKILEEQGYIRKQVAILDSDKIGLPLTVLVWVGLNSHAAKIMQNFSDTIRSFNEVTQCYLVTGQSADYHLQVRVPNLKAYQHFLLNKLTCIEGVSSVQSSFVLQTLADTTALPLDLLP